ncbi:MAG: hypothetical protein ACRDQU_12450 [Pseudonocardiaceae bacterium]
MNRAAHLAWAKDRAFAELDADRHGAGPVNALNSIISDLRKHPDTCGHNGLMLTSMLMFDGHLTDATDVRKHIEGFR